MIHLPVPVTRLQILRVLTILLATGMWVIGMMGCMRINAWSRELKQSMIENAGMSIYTTNAFVVVTTITCALLTFLVPLGLTQVLWHYIRRRFS